MPHTFLHDFVIFITLLCDFNIVRDRCPLASKKELLRTWATVFNGLKARGVEDILIAVTDGLKGMTEALETVYPQTLHQTCIVHLIRASTSFVSHKDRAAVCKELKPIYQAVDADAAERALERFGSTPVHNRCAG